DPAEPSDSDLSHRGRSPARPVACHERPPDSMDRDAAKTVLIVEHQSATREALATVFRSEGYRVVTAADSNEALRHLRSATRPNLILLDWREPATETAPLIAARQDDASLASVPLVIMTE